ncbi:MAG: alpha/beta fold hydrolase [Acidimicrobiales bacterium]|nr:alpha/beta fold hydrolase [Acidimicrobiales bacterium]
MTQPRGRRVLAAVLTTVAMAVATTACTAPPPDFYNPPTDPSGAPGTVIKTAPSSLSGSSDVSAVAVQYRSRSGTGQANAVTGTVFTPDAPWSGPGDRPIVALAQGTQGLGDQCAPSKSLANGTNYELDHVKALLAKGWAVAVTDYEGLGMPGTHTYIVADAEAHAVLDVVRAATEVPELDLSPSAPVGIVGYSQGGQAAARAAEIESTYAPELNVVGVVAGGVPSDPEELGTTLDGGLFFAFLAMAAVGLDAAYPELDLDSYLNDTGRQLLEQNQDACLADGLLALGFQSIDNLTTTNPLEQPDWQARLDENRLGSVAPEVPVLQYHAVFDEIIPYTQGTTLRDAWCAGGAQVRWLDLFLAEHALGIYQGQNDTLQFLTDRFSGAEFQSTCTA